MMQSTTDGLTPKIYRVADISRRFGISKSYIYHLGKTGNFPKPFVLVPGGAAKGWIAQEVEDWFEERIKQRG